MAASEIRELEAARIVSIYAININPTLSPKSCDPASQHTHTFKEDTLRVVFISCDLKWRSCLFKINLFILNHKKKLKNPWSLEKHFLDPLMLTPKTNETKQTENMEMIDEQDRKAYRCGAYAKEWGSEGRGISKYHSFFYAFVCNSAGIRNIQ